METLTVSDVTLSFGGLNALTGVSLEFKPGLITSVIGPNGAGKTSLLNCISGFYHPTTGEIHYGEHRLNRASPHQVSILGIARAFQNIELFGGMTVLDNLLLARHQNLKYNLLQAVVFFGKTHADAKEIAFQTGKIPAVSNIDSMRKEVSQKIIQIAGQLPPAENEVGVGGAGRHA